VETAKGDIALNTANVKSMANTLATLRAVQWAGAGEPEPGAGDAAVTITFRLADRSSNTVKVGAAVGDYWNASAAGFAGVFEISKPDHDALTGDVLPVSKAGTSPTGSPAAEAAPSASAAPQVSTSPVEAK